MISFYTATTLPIGKTVPSSVSTPTDRCNKVETSTRFNGVLVVAAFAILTSQRPTEFSVIKFESKTANSPQIYRFEVVTKQSNREDLLAISRIRGFSTYVNGWDGPGTVAPTQSTIKDAEIFTRYLFTIGQIIAPYISASGDGEINFYWKRDDFLIDLGFAGNGSYSYYANLPNNCEIIADEASLRQSLPQEIISFISKTV
jgi:hypothetical protein